jgi:hypothetical protein
MSRAAGKRSLVRAICIIKEEVVVVVVSSGIQHKKKMRKWAAHANMPQKRRFTKFCSGGIVRGVSTDRTCSTPKSMFSLEKGVMH